MNIVEHISTSGYRSDLGSNFTFESNSTMGSLLWKQSNVEKHKIFDIGSASDSLWYRNNGGVSYKLLHSGNIGNYAATQSWVNDGFINKTTNNDIIDINNWSINSKDYPVGKFVFTSYLGYPTLQWDVSKAYMSDEGLFYIEKAGIAQVDPDAVTYFEGRFDFNKTGASPFNVQSDIVVNKLNADLLDGLHASDFVQTSALSNYVTINTSQSITGQKTFTQGIIGQSWVYGGDIALGNKANSLRLQKKLADEIEGLSETNGWAYFKGAGFKVDGTVGFLKSDGTVYTGSIGNTYTSSNGILLTGSNFTPTYGTSANTIAQGNDSRINNGQTAFSWGNHANAGYLQKNINFDTNLGYGLQIADDSFGGEAGLFDMTQEKLVAGLFNEHYNYGGLANGGENGLYIHRVSGETGIGYIPSNGDPKLTVAGKIKAIGGGYITNDSNVLLSTLTDELSWTQKRGGGEYHFYPSTAINLTDIDSLNVIKFGTKGEVIANQFIKSGGTGNNVLLDDGNTISLASLGAVTKIVKKLSSNISSTSTTRTNVTGFVFNCEAGKTYRIEIIASYQTGVTTTGGSMGFVLPTGSGTIKGFMEAEIVQTTGATGLKTSIRAINATNTTAGSFMTSTGVGVINSDHSWYALVTFKCTANGTFQVQWGSEVASSNATLMADSVMIVEEI